MLDALFWGFVGASALVIAAEISFLVKFDRLVVGLIMAFGVGALISLTAPVTATGRASRDWVSELKASPLKRPLGLRRFT